MSTTDRDLSYKHDSQYDGAAVKVRVWWTEKTCKEEAKKYKTRAEFYKESPAAYNAAYRLDILEKICDHMKWTKEGRWSREGCLVEALKYDVMMDFRKNSPSAYHVAKANGWLHECCSHMVTKPYDYSRIESNNNKQIEECHSWVSRNSASKHQS